MPKKNFYFSIANNRKRKKAAEEVERLKSKVIEGQGTGYVGKTYTCPLINQPFRGSCPIVQCAANITQHKRSNSCCIYIESDKQEFDKWDLIHQLEIKESKLYKLKDEGEKKVIAVMLLNRILTELRSENKEIFCSKDIAEKSNFIRNSYLGLKELQGKFSDVVVIRNNMKKIKQFLSNHKTQITLQELFGTSDLTAIQ